MTPAGEQVLGHIRLADGASPPFGAPVVSGKPAEPRGWSGMTVWPT
ncbi:hypothetical protein MYA98_20305 [Salmonella sp. WGH-01]|nr:hypothetical protein MYA98_20305 [Salmonella sp. WGH-01]